MRYWGSARRLRRITSPSCCPTERRSRFLGASVLSHDFYQALMGSNNLSIPGLRVIAEWSIEHSCMSSDMQEKVYKDFEEKWFVFCRWIIDAYGQQ
ncbi:hypothetical protein FOQG_11970 [Fusarium oxysporum f. sp. raphani 54005]|uniref:Uncharacterized protein n=1 Tax=Fusarium oxysporum f. sp. raphani 54005 TaxID=1089458 RepID=X0BNQ6_FUSOX|nr:hypothetical protein FOQG_11970 [Fusarium oxysporum f. sp. raphani 54005]